MDWHRIRRQNPRDLFTHGFDHVANSKQRSRLALLQRFDDARRHRHTEIGSDERFLQLIPVDRFAGKLLRESLKEFHRDEGVNRESRFVNRCNALTLQRITALFTASRAGRSRSLRTRSRMPFTKRPDSAPPKVFASSMASLIETTGGMSSRKSIS